jgi:Holliday junction resolvasome RuvABC endonuclease subunit
MTTVVGIDSAENSGVAIMVDDRLVRHGVVKVEDWNDVERVGERLATYKPDLVAIEAPYIGVNGVTALVLAVLLGRWLEAFESRGIATVTVQASAWQREVLAGRIVFRTKSAEQKIACIDWARETFGVAMTGDEADACAIAWWARGRVPVPDGTKTLNHGVLVKPKG